MNSKIKILVFPLCQSQSESVSRMSIAPVRPTLALILFLLVIDSKQSINVDIDISLKGLEVEVWMKQLE